MFRNLTITKIISLLFGIIFFVIVITSFLISRNINRIESDILQVVNTQIPLEQSVLEMEINLGETARGVLDYVRDRDPIKKLLIKDSESDFEKYYKYFSDVSTDKGREKKLAETVFNEYQKFAKLGDEIVAIEDSQFYILNELRDNIDAMDETIDVDIQNKLRGGSSQAQKKLIASLDMEVNVDELFLAVEGYLVNREPTLKDEMLDAKSDFNRYLKGFRALGLDKTEELWAAQLSETFDNAVIQAKKIVDYEDDKHGKLELFEEKLELLDDILDDQLQPIILAKTVSASKDAISSAETAIQMLYLLLILVFVVAVSSFFFARKYIIHPIKKLKLATNDVSKGYLDRRTSILTGGELGDLGSSFNDMLDRIQAQNEDLQIAKIKAENSVKTKSDFLASMSHEIRTPMNGVLGMLGLLSNSELSVEQQRKVRIARNSAQALLSLINDILDFSKVEAGKLELEELDFDLRSLLEDIAQSMAFRADEKGLELLIDVAGVEQSMVKGDPSRLRQIVTNLVGNAIKFTEAGEIVISAKLKRHDAEEFQLVCSISDTGIGIPSDRIASLFDSFTQVDASTTRKFGGTGLGLAISKKLCLLMQGDIKVTSELGQGSCFEFTLQMKRSSRSIKIVPQIDMRQLKILVVDDNATNREILRLQLEHWGANVVEAESGPSALALCDQYAEQLFDIALLDMQMPEMDGETLCREIRQQQRFDSLKLLMMTSMPTPNSLKNLYDIGFSGYFTKPVSTSDLFDALSVVVAEGSGQEQNRSIVTRNYLDTLERRKPQDAISEELPVWPAQTRILLVEDNQINQLVVQGMLEELKLSCDIAGNGLEAIDALREAPDDVPYTLIFMDCQMPELDGYQATGRVRAGKAGERYLELPIIAMTANAMLGDKEKCLEAGMDDYLSKPLEPKELLEALRKWLTQPQGIREVVLGVNSVGNGASTLVPSAAVTNGESHGKETREERQQLNPLALIIPAGLSTIDFSKHKPQVATLPTVFLQGLAIYQKQYRLFADKLTESVKNHDLENVRNLVHALKGGSRQLGMQLVYELAVTIEENIIKHQTIENGAIETLIEWVQLSTIDAQTILTANASTDEETADSSRDFLELKKELLVLLSESAFIQQELIDEFARSTKKSDRQALGEKIISALDSFDYEEAKNLLEGAS